MTIFLTSPLTVMKNVKFLWLLVLLLGAALWIGSCNYNEPVASMPSNQVNAKGIFSSVPEGTAVYGQVNSKAGDPLAGVQVVLGKEVLAVTDANGIYYIDDVSPANKAALCFVHPDFVQTMHRFQVIEGSPCRVNANLLPRANHVKLINGRTMAGGVAYDGTADATYTDAANGMSITIKAGTPLVYASSGNAFTGTAYISGTYVDPNDSVAVAEAGGGMFFPVGQDSLGVLETSGMGEIVVQTANNQRLNLANGYTAEISFTIDPGLTSDIPGDYMLDSTGTWQPIDSQAQVDYDPVTGVSIINTPTLILIINKDKPINVIGLAIFLDPNGNRGFGENGPYDDEEDDGNTNPGGSNPCNTLNTSVSNQLVQAVAQKSKTATYAYTNKAGRANLQLAPGEKYEITLSPCNQTYTLDLSNVTSAAAYQVTNNQLVAVQK